MGEVLVNCPHQGAALCHVGRLSGVETVVWWLCWELSLQSVAGGGNLFIPFPGDVVLPVLGMLQVAPRAGGCLGATGLWSFT